MPRPASSEPTTPIASPSAAAPQRVDVVLQLVADDRELAERRVQHALLRAAGCLPARSRARSRTPAAAGTARRTRSTRSAPPAARRGRRRTSSTTAAEEAQPAVALLEAVDGAQALVEVHLLEEEGEGGVERALQPSAWTPPARGLTSEGKSGGGSVGGAVRHACVSTPYVHRALRVRSDPAEPRRWRSSRAPARGACCAPTAACCGARTSRTAYSQAVLELLARGARRAAVRQPRAPRQRARAALPLARARPPPRAARPQPAAGRAWRRAVVGGPGERELELADPRAEVHPLVAHRLELRQVARARAPADPRPAARARLPGRPRGWTAPSSASRYGWSHEKYRKVAQRARARLRRLAAAEPWGGVGQVERASTAWLDGRVAPARGSPTCLRATSRAPIRGSCPTFGAGSEQRDRDPPMNPPHYPHRRVPWDATGRSQARPRGDAHPRACGRGPGISPPWPSAARVAARQSRHAPALESRRRAHGEGIARDPPALRAAAGLPHLLRGGVPRRRGLARGRGRARVRPARGRRGARRGRGDGDVSRRSRRSPRSSRRSSAWLRCMRLDPVGERSRLRR